MNRILLSFLLSLSALSTIFGQTGGEGVFNFLQLTNSAKAAALGGIQVALPDPDPELLLQNPALLSPGMNNILSVNYTKYLAGIGFGYGAYARDLGKYGMAAFGIQFVDYGQFVAADETGVITGSFSASDYALNLTYAKQIGSLCRVGVNIRPIYSHLENYWSTGISVDFGVTRQSSDQLTTLALCFKNIGKQLRTYYGGSEHEKIAWSLQAGCTHQLLHAPVRLNITAYDLNRWNSSVSASDPNGIEISSSENSLLPMIMRHLTLGAEIFPENKVTFRLGYNHRRHADLTTGDQTGLVGFSTGLGINVSAFRFNYALSGYAIRGMVHNFSLSANLSGILK
jgi:hypothetical protein